MTTELTHRQLCLEERAVVFVEEDLEVPLAPARSLLVAVPHLVRSLTDGQVLLWQNIQRLKTYQSSTVISYYVTYTEPSCKVAVVILLGLMEHHVIPTHHGRLCDVAD